MESQNSPLFPRLTFRSLLCWCTPRYSTKHHDSVSPWWHEWPFLSCVLWRPNFCSSVAAPYWRSQREDQIAMAAMVFVLLMDVFCGFSVAGAQWAWGRVGRWSARTWVRCEGLLSDSINCSNCRDCGIAKLPLLGLRVVDFVGLWASEQQILPFKTGVNTLGVTCIMYNRYIANITHLTHWPGWGDAGTRQQLGQPEAIWAGCRSTLIHRRWSALRGTKSIQKKRRALLQKQDEIVYMYHLSICSKNCKAAEERLW